MYKLTDTETQLLKFIHKYKMYLTSIKYKMYLTSVLYSKAKTDVLED